MKRRAVLVVLALSATGCPALWPGPEDGSVVQGQRILVYDFAFVVPGETTRAEVVARLGEPYTVLTTPSVLVYPWRVLERRFAWGVAAGRVSIPFGTFPRFREETLLVALDAEGTVQRLETTSRYPEEGTEREHAYAWAQRQGLCGERPTARFVPQPSPPDRGMLYVYRPQALWETHAAVNVRLADSVVAQLRQGEYFRTTLPPGEHRVRVGEREVPVAVEAGERRFLRVRGPNAEAAPTFPDEAEALAELTSIAFPIVPAL